MYLIIRVEGQSRFFVAKYEDYDKAVLHVKFLQHDHPEETFSIEKLEWKNLYFNRKIGVENR